MRQRTMEDLQRKVDGDVHSAVMRTFNLIDSDDDEARIALMLQAACTAQMMLAQLIEQTGGQPPAMPHFGTLLLVSMLCARGNTNSEGMELIELMNYAKADVIKLKMAGVIVHEEDDHDSQQGQTCG